MNEPTVPRSPLEAHDLRARGHQSTADRLEKQATRVSALRLLAFLGAAVFVISGVRGGEATNAWVGAALGVVFVALVIVHARLAERLRDAEIRRDLHHRHIDRVVGTWVKHEVDATERIPTDHPYARDIDLLGAGSLVQRIDVTQTEAGARALVGFLAAPASPAVVRRRQEAVRELAGNLDFRESLEAAGRLARGKGKLDGAPFLAFVRREPLFRSGWARVAIRCSPLILLGLFTLASTGVVPRYWAGLYLIAQSLVALSFTRRCHEAFDLVSARRGYVEAFRKMLETIERTAFESDLLAERKRAVFIREQPPSRYLAALDRYVGLSDFRTQFPVHLVANFVLLWDLSVLERLEAWNAEIGGELEGALDALGELEALSSLAAFAFVEPASTFPTIAETGAAFVAEEIAHPLLPADRRVTNSLSLPGPSSALIVTGSNMAGKSTLLRAVGLNIALAFAGGPVIARRFTLPPVRLRASMRIDDDLQRGASYFHAELTKLRSVVDAADMSPPIFFLLDELLRGTNARARHLGGRAVLAHLLDRGAMGLAATHDVALSELEDERPGAVRNVHFTDVMDGDEMLFDYRLRDGVVRTSNALRLLAMAGVDVPGGVS